MRRKCRWHAKKWLQETESLRGTSSQAVDETKKSTRARHREAARLRADIWRAVRIKIRFDRVHQFDRFDQSPMPLVRVWGALTYMANRSVHVRDSCRADADAALASLRPAVWRHAHLRPPVSLFEWFFELFCSRFELRCSSCFVNAHVESTQVTRCAKRRSWKKQKKRGGKWWGLGHCKKFDEAGVQAKSGSANVDVEVDVKIWFHCALVSIRVHRKRSGRSPDLAYPPPPPPRFVSFGDRLLSACLLWSWEFLGQINEERWVLFAMSADTVKASFFQSLGSRGDVKVSSTKTYTAAWLENSNSNTGRLSNSNKRYSNKETQRSHALTTAFRLDSQIHHDQTFHSVFVDLAFPPCFVTFFDPPAQRVTSTVSTWDKATWTKQLRTRTSNSNKESNSKKETRYLARAGDANGKAKMQLCLPHTCTDLFAIHDNAPRTQTSAIGLRSNRSNRWTRSNRILIRTARHTDASDRFRSRGAGCYTVRDAVPPLTAGSTHACEQNDRQRRRERESPIWVKGKDKFQATSSFTFDRFVLNGPCCRHGFEIDKNSRPFKTLSAFCQIQDFFKVWKGFLKIQDLFKT